MSRRVLLHVGCPKTGTSYLQDVLFRNQPRAARARHPLPRRPLRRALPRRARPDDAAVGRPRDRGRRRLGPARRRRCATGTAPRSSATRSSPGPRRPRSSGRSPRSATPRSTSCCRCATWSARSRRSGRRTSSTAATSPTRSSSGPSATRPATPASARGSGRCRRSPTSSSGGARLAAARAGPPGHAAAAGRRPRRAVAPLLPAPSASTACPSTSPPSGRTRPSACPETVAPAHHQRSGSPRSSRRPTTARWCASCSPTRRCRAASPSARLGLAPEDHAWAQELSRQLGRRCSPSGGTTSPARSTTCSGPTLGTFADPDTATADELLPPALDAISALLVEGARLRAVEERLHEELREAREERDRARATPAYRARRKVVTHPRGQPRRTRHARRLPAPARTQGLTRRCPRCRAGSGTTSGLPPTRQQLAVGVAADLQVAKPSAPVPTTPPTTGTLRPTVVASRLPATRAMMSVATTAEMVRVDGRVVGRGRGERHRRRGELALLDQLVRPAPRPAGGRGSRCGRAGRRGRDRGGGRCRPPSGTG